MKRRMYFLFPDVERTRVAVNDLRTLDIDLAHMHTIARADIDLGDLPVATDPQRHDALAYLEDRLWGGNLLLFGLATVALVAAGLAGSVILALLALLVMIASVTAGAWFAMRIPQTRLSEFRQALQHGEILLLVDVSRDCIEEIEALMQRRHPEAVVGGSGWTPGAFGV
jgi:hypothetical protein